MKLLLAAPCNVVLNDPDLGHSLIGVFHDIRVNVLPGSEVPADAMLPREWAIFSKWALEPHEVNREYTQVTELYWPDGKLVGRNSSALQASGTAMSFISRNTAFPFGQNGNVRILFWMEESGEAVSEGVEILISVNTQKNLVTQ